MLAMRGNRTRPDVRGLEALALAQAGYFDRQDALRHGVSDQLLHHHTASGRFERVFPGVFRLATAPIGPQDEYFLAWVWTNYRGAISHESALALFKLGDVLPTRVHVTLPRGVTKTSAPFALHWAKLPDGDVQMYDGVRVTTPPRTIADAAATGTDPAQVHKAIHQALARALTTPEDLRSAAARTGHLRERRNVVRMVEAALHGAA
jgi:predicted transcriptional regulator of viral defense system